jgi:hypothetical protein
VSSVLTLRRSARWVVAIAAIGYLAVATFPASYYPVRIGLDTSWVYGLNHFFNSQFRFGRDVNFTYGPLGFLLYPVNLGYDVLLAILYRAAMAAALIFVLALLSPGRWIGLAFFAPAYGVALGLGHTFDFHLLVLAALAALAALERRSLAGLLAIAALSAPLWLTKFSLGLGVAAVVATVALAWRLAFQGSLRGALAIGGAHLVSLFGVACLLLGSPAAFARWLRVSFEFTGGYSVAMSYDPGWTDVRKGMAIVGIYVAVTAVLFVLRRGAALPLAFLAGPLFLAFKAGFVREDGHVRSFFGFVAAALAVALLTGASARERIASAVALILAVGLGVRGELKRGYLNGEIFANVASGKAGLHGIQLALHPRATARDLDRVTEASVASDRLAEEVRQAIGRGTVLIVPWEVAHCFIDRLECVPLQTLQEYDAYTPDLDAIIAAQLEGSAAPEFVLVHTLQSTEERHVPLDLPQAWRKLMDGYAPVRLRSEEVFLLRRRSAPKDTQSITLSEQKIRAGEWVSVPHAGRYIFAEMGFELSGVGRFLKLVYRIPAGYLELKRASGAIERRRLIFETSANGLLVQPFASRLSDLHALFQGSEGDRVVALRIVGEAPRYYRREISLRWLTEPNQPAPRGGASR